MTVDIQEGVMALAIVKIRSFQYGVLSVRQLFSQFQSLLQR